VEQERRVVRSPLLPWWSDSHQLPDVLEQDSGCLPNVRGCGRNKRVTWMLCHPPETKMQSQKSLLSFLHLDYISFLPYSVSWFVRTAISTSLGSPNSVSKVILIWPLLDQPQMQEGSQLTLRLKDKHKSLSL
jgi:hypothetical protein